MDCEQNINMGCWDLFANHGVVDFRKARKKAEQQKELLQIKTPSLRKTVNQLSGGNQQKIVLAKGISRDTKVLIFDEPTRGIDVGVKYEIYKLMNMLSDQGVAIIMISSELPEIMGMSDRIYTMYQGRITGEIPGCEATQEKLLSYIAGLTENKA